MNNKLSPDYVVELIKACFQSPKIMDICKQHLQYHYLENEAQKKVFKYIVESSEINNVVPTVGTIGQTFKTDKDIISLLSRIKKANVTNENHDLILDSFETFIKDSRFQACYDHVGNLYNEGKHEEAMKYLAEESTAINEFRLKDNFYSRVFADFEERQQRRQLEQETVFLNKCPWGIHCLDRATRGGINKGTSALLLGRSGGGKSTAMRWTGLCNARVGNRVVHFQAEGTEKECLDAYDAGWTSVKLEDMEIGFIPAAKRIKIVKAHKDILGSGGEIFVFAAEQFDSMTLNDCRTILIDIEKIYGKVDLVIFDYLELFNVKGTYYNSEQGERKRREHRTLGRISRGHEKIRAKVTHCTKQGQSARGQSIKSTRTIGSLNRHVQRNRQC